MKPNGIVQMVKNSFSSFSDKLYLNLYENHLSYIINLFTTFLRRNFNVKSINSYLKDNGV